MPFILRNQDSMAFWLLLALLKRFLKVMNEYSVVESIHCNLFLRLHWEVKCSVIQLMHCLKMVNQWVCCPVLSYERLAAQIASRDMGAPWPRGLIGLLATIVPDIGGPVILLVPWRPCPRWCRVMHTCISWNEMRTKRSHYFCVFSGKRHHTAPTKASTTKIWLPF